ncbi:hypothetical protein SDC9_165878 [bioreactor metagenome]|uniref:Uncharacterized protein n=1 Tax=bioreactor metagenome TaxID=1076179 RepID=A0A645FVH3_9ZZZZ
MKPEVTCEIKTSTSITYREVGSNTSNQSEIMPEVREGLKEGLGMTDDTINDFYKNGDHYYLYVIDCIITNKSEFKTNIDGIKKNGTEGLYWADDSFPNLGLGPYEIDPYGIATTSCMELWVKDIEPEPGFEKKILKLLENNNLKVSYKKVYEGFDRYFAPNNTYYTDVVVHQPE